MRVTGWWKVTDVYHETGNIGVVVNPPHALYVSHSER